MADIDYCYRVGNNPRDKDNSVRPILVKLLREDYTRQIYKNRLILRQSEEYAKVYLNEDLPQVITQRRADIKSVYLNARDKGHTAKMLGTKIVVDNVPYQHGDLENLPVGLRLSDSKVQKVKGGYAFASKNAYLSNMYISRFRFNGRMFDSVERAYQFERAIALKAPEIAQQILDCRTPMDCKRLSGQVWSNVAWDTIKRDKMKSIVQEKFAQCESLMNTLFTTGNKTLIEGTTDAYWGAAAIFGSKLLKNGKWKGQNQLGAILGEVREDLKRMYNWTEMQSIASENTSESGGLEIPPGQAAHLPTDPVGTQPPTASNEQLTGIGVDGGERGTSVSQTSHPTAPPPPPPPL